jgi:hypothetical protein
MERDELGFHSKENKGVSDFFENNEVSELKYGPNNLEEEVYFFGTKNKRIEISKHGLFLKPVKQVAG